MNSTQKVSSRVLNSRNMMSVARTSYEEMEKYYLLAEIWPAGQARQSSLDPVQVKGT